MVRFSQSFVVEASDIDEQGHVNNVAFLKWVQSIAVAHWRHAATEEMQDKYSWVVVRHEIDYMKPAFDNDEIVACTWVGEWTAATCERFTEISRRDTLLVKGRTLWCMIGRDSLRPARIGKDLIDRFS